jgi:hypothetical protein
LATPLNQVEAQVDVARHLDRATERDLTIALREMQITYREQRVLDVDREVDARALRQVLDVHVAAVVARRHGPGGLAGHAGEVVGRQRAQQRVLRG